MHSDVNCQIFSTKIPVFGNKAKNMINFTLGPINPGNNMNTHQPSPQLHPSGWCYYAGWFFFILSFLMPLLTPLIAFLGFNQATTALLIGVFLVGGPEIILLIAIGLWGKQTFDYFMGFVSRFFKRFVPSGCVSTTRYYIGLFILITSCFPVWILAYLPSLVSDAVRIYILLGFDALFFVSFFILGGDFWEKIHALFIPNSITINKT